MPISTTISPRFSSSLRWARSARRRAVMSLTSTIEWVSSPESSSMTREADNSRKTRVPSVRRQASSAGLSAIEAEAVPKSS